MAEPRTTREYLIVEGIADPDALDGMFEKVIHSLASNPSLAVLPESMDSDISTWNINASEPSASIMNASLSAPEGDSESFLRGVTENVNPRIESLVES